MNLGDVRCALRELRKSPGFTIVAVLSLALGIGANTAIFSLIDALLLQSLPVRDPQQLMFLQTRAIKVGNSIRISQRFDTEVLRAVQEHATLLAGASGVRNQSHLSVQAGNSLEIASGDFVDGSYFRVLGVNALVGRVLSPDDDRLEGFTGQGWPAVITFGYWQERFAHRPDIVGQTLKVNTIPFVIVGVTPRGFGGLQMDEEARLMMPLAAAEQVEEGRLATTYTKTPLRMGTLFVRLKPDATSRAAEAQLTPVVRNALAAEVGLIPITADVNQLAVELTPANRGESDLRQHFSTALTVLMAVVGLVLLIACANVANLLLARASVRQKEIAIRLSLGCTRWRLARQLLVEGLLLSALGGAVGVVFAFWARNLIARLATASQVTAPRLPIARDLPILLFTGAVCVVTALLFGLAPALRATAIDFADMLKSGRTSRLSGRVPLSKPLVAAQVAISLVLVTGAVMFLGTLRSLYRVHLGYNTQNVTLCTVNPHLAGYGPERTAQFFDQVLERVQALPQVESATWAQIYMLAPYVGLRPLRVPGYVPKAGEQPTPWIVAYPVGPGFFHTMQLPLAAGREFTPQDSSRAAPLVAVMNQAMARHYFGQRSPIGQKISITGTPDIEIVGIARDAKYRSPRDEDEEALFLPLLQHSTPWATLLVRTTSASSQTAADVVRTVRDVDRNVPVYDVTTMDRQRDNRISQERLLAVLTGFFSLLALGLSGIGLYGVLAYNVAQRTAEIGIRMALGADRGTILGMIGVETAKVVGGGIAGGIAVTLAVGRLVRSILFGLTPTDTSSMVLAALVLTVVALAAALLPARRAVHVDPMVALRHE